MACPLVTRENATQSTACADQVSDLFSDCFARRWHRRCPCSRRLRHVLPGSSKKNNKDLGHAGRGGGGGLWPKARSRPAASGAVFWGNPAAAATCSAWPPVTHF